MTTYPLVFVIELIIDADAIRSYFSEAEDPSLMEENLKLHEENGSFFQFHQFATRTFVPTIGMDFHLPIADDPKSDSHPFTLSVVTKVQDNLSAPYGKGCIVVTLRIPNTWGPNMPTDFKRPMWTPGDYNNTAWTKKVE